MLRGLKCREVDRNKLRQGRNINDFVLATSKSMFLSIKYPGNLQCISVLPKMRAVSEKTQPPQFSQLSRNDTLHLCDQLSGQPVVTNDKSPWFSSILTAMWQDDVPQITAIRKVKGLFPFRSELKSAPMTPEYMVFIKNKIIIANCHHECLNKPNHYFV